MKLKAFTIVESMMALIVITISFSAGMTVYLTILQGDAFPSKTKAQAALNSFWMKTQKEQRFIDEKLNWNRFFIEKKVLPYRANQPIFEQVNVYQVSLKVFSPDETLIIEEEHLIRVPYD